MDNKIDFSKLSNEEIERLNNSIKKFIENFSNINQNIINNIREISKTIQSMQIKIPDLSQISIDYTNLIKAISESLSLIQNIQFQDFISDKIEDFNNLGNNKTYSKKNHTNLIDNIQIDKVNVEIHNDMPPNKNNLFTIISNLVLIIEFLKIINAPDEIIQLVLDLIKKILNFIV